MPNRDAIGQIRVVHSVASEGIEVGSGFVDIQLRANKYNALARADWSSELITPDSIRNLFNAIGEALARDYQIQTGVKGHYTDESRKDNGDGSQGE